MRFFLLYGALLVTAITLYGQSPRTITQNKEIVDYAIGGDNDQLVVLTNDGIIRYYDLVSGTIKNQSIYFEEGIRSIEINDDGTLLLIKKNNEVKVMEIATGNILDTETSFSGYDIVAAHFGNLNNPDEYYLLVETFEDQRIFKKNINTKDKPARVLSRKFSDFDVGKEVYFMVSENGKEFHQVSISNAEITWTKKSVDGRPQSYDYDPKSHSFVIVEAFKYTVYQLDIGKILPRHESVESVKVIPGTNHVVLTKRKENAFQLYEMGTIFPFETIETNTSIAEYKVSPDAKYLVMRNGDTKIDYWNLEDYQKEETVIAEDLMVQSEEMSVEEEEPAPVMTEEDIDPYSDDQVYRKFRNEVDKILAYKSYLFDEKNQFESTAEYEMRKSQAESFRSNTIDRFRQDLIARDELEIVLNRRRQNYLDSLDYTMNVFRAGVKRDAIADSYEELTMVVQGVGQYSADNQEWPIRVNNTWHQLQMPKDDIETKLFGERYNQYYVIGYRQLMDDGVTYDTFNVRVINTVNRSCFSYGKEKEPLFRKFEDPCDLIQSQATEIVATVKKENPEDKIMDALAESLEQTTYHALLFGANDYKNLNPLQFPISDSKRLEEVLINDYGFSPSNVTRIENPTEGDIVDQLNRLSNTVRPNDNVLIFYAGHGVWEDKVEQGYWLPVDADKNSISSWVSNNTIRSYVRAIPAKHTLLISDACFSGGIFASRDANVSLSANAYMKLYRNQSRKAITSGMKNEEVADNSAFIKYFLKALEENESTLISAEDLFVRIKPTITMNSTSVPQFGTIHNTGDEGGDFIFVKKK